MIVRLCIATVLISVFFSMVTLGDAALLSDANEYSMWLSYPPEKFGLYENLQSEEKLGQISLFSAKGEYEPFLLIVRPKGSNTLYYPKIEFDDLKSDSNDIISAENFSYYLVDHVNIDVPSTASVLPGLMKQAIPDFNSSHVAFGGTGRTGYWPDILIPSDSWQCTGKNLFSGENTQFWVKIKVPRGIKSGLYCGNITYKVRGSESKIPLTLKVWDAELPQNSPLKVTACFDTRLPRKSWKTEDFKKFYRTMIYEYQQTGADPIYPPPNIRVDAQSVVIDTNGWDEMLAYCLDDLKLNHFFFPVTPDREIACIYNFPNGNKVRGYKWYGIQVCDANYAITPEFRKAFGEQYLKPVVAHLKAKGWFEKMYMPSMDEPRCYEDYLFISNWCDFIHSIDGQIKIFLTSNYPFFGFPEDKLLGKIKYWCPNNSYVEQFWKSRMKQGDEFSFYTNWMLFSPDWPAVNPRLMGWIAWKTNANGFLTYNIGEGASRYLIYMRGIKMFGSGQMLYMAPFEPKLYPSIRWEMEREGFEDYLVLYQLRTMVEEYKKSASMSPIVVEAEKFLASADSQIIPHSIFPPEKPWKCTEPVYTTSNRTVWEVKNRACELIEQLVKSKAVKNKDEVELLYP